MLLSSVNTVVKFAMTTKLLRKELSRKGYIKVTPAQQLILINMTTQSITETVHVKLAF